jgi:hypothetical protein
MTLWRCERDWPDATAWIVCGGASLRGFDFERLRGRKVIAINSSVYSVPFCDVLFFGDRRWWVTHQNSIPKTVGSIVSNSPTVNDARIKSMMKVKPPPGIVDDRCILPMSWTSLGPSLQLAVHLGVARVVLLGADCTAAKDGKVHHHDEHPWPQRPDWQKLQLEALESTVKPLRKRNVEVINASLVSVIPWWRKRSPESCLEEYD